MTGGLVAFPYLVLGSLMLVGCVAAQGHVMTDCYLCFLDWVVLPLFILVTIASYVILTIISIGTSVNADFCGGQGGTPDMVIVSSLDAVGFDQSDMFYKTVRYIVYQCTAAAQEDPFLFLREYDANIVSTQQ